MKLLQSRTALTVLISIAGASLFTSCTVQEEGAWISNKKAEGSEVKKRQVVHSDPDQQTWSERMAEQRAEREKQRAEAEKQREKELAAKQREKELEARKLAAEKKAEEAREKALAEKKAKEAAAEEKARQDRLAEKKAEEARKKALAEQKAKEEEERRRARIAAKKKAEEAREARRLASAERDAERSRSNEVQAAATRRSGGGFFSRMAVGTPSQYKSEGHHVKINRSVLAGLNSSNAKIEIDLSEQRARVYRTGAMGKELAIETQISSGKAGHNTPTGTYRIQEKKVEKRSTLYGSWVNSSGATVRSSGESWARPAGGSRFVGAEMPYWMRVTGGVGMHIGYVPNGPASHGCIRVPASVQPLIYSKVGVGTPVTIRY